MTSSGARLVRGLGAAVGRQLGLGVERRRAQQELREVQRQLASEIAASQLLQTVSAELIPASDVEVLYERIIDAAVAIMRSDGRRQSR